MTPQEFASLKPGDVIRGSALGEGVVIERVDNTPGFLLTPVEPHRDPGWYACNPDFWTLVRRATPPKGATIPRKHRAKSAGALAPGSRKP